MQKYLTNFLKQSVFKDVLVHYEEQGLTDLGVSLSGDRLRLKQAIKQLKSETEEKRKDTSPPNSESRPTPQRGKVRLADLKKNKNFGNTATTVIIPTPSSPRSEEELESLKGETAG